MSKKDEAYVLFAQGKCLGTPELMALDLKPRTEKGYFQSWRKSVEEAEPGQMEEAEPIEEAAPPGVPISTLSIDQEFEFAGNHYKECPNGVSVFLEWSPSGQVRVEKYRVSIPLDTLVKPV